MRCKHFDVLQDMACDPSWKTDGGFKSNYMSEVHKRILIKIPSFTKQVTPHLESKIKWLKTKYHVINDMLRESGCQWNDVGQKIACERQWFESYSKNHKEAKGMWDFKFPYLNQLELVYGKDRATGEVVQGFGDVIHNMEYDTGRFENGGDFYIPIFEEDNDEYVESQSTQSVRQLGKKEKRSTSVGGTIAKKTMTKVTKSEKSTLERMQAAIDELMNLNLPNGDVFKAISILTVDKDKIDAFLSFHLICGCTT